MITLVAISALDVACLQNVRILYGGPMSSLTSVTIKATFYFNVAELTIYNFHKFLSGEPF
jgi:hypothetical protein